MPSSAVTIFEKVWVNKASGTPTWSVNTEQGHSKPRRPQI